MKEIICIICGHPVKGNQKTGRPKRFHKECRELKNAFSLLESRLETFRNMNPKKDKKKDIRGSLWSLANLMN